MYAEKTEKDDRGREEAKVEHFFSRGIGKDYIHGCFVCRDKGIDKYIKELKKELKAHKKEFTDELTDEEIKRIEESGRDRQLEDNIAGFVDTKESGERIVDKMFNNVGARLDYREHEPNWIQVKIGACPEHLDNLKDLDRYINETGGIITKEMVEHARVQRISRR